MLSLPPITLRLRGWKLIDRVALAFLLLCAIALGAACGLLFVYASDLPEIRALETYRPTVVTEIYADDGQLVGSFALQRCILMTYEQCPRVLYNAVTAIEDQHYEEHWGIDFPRIAGPKPLVERLNRSGGEISLHPRIGSLALRLCRVAEGRLDAAFAGGQSRDWDLAAANLIVQEANGRMTTLSGDTILYNRREVAHGVLVAAGRDRHASIVSYFRKSPLP